VIAWHFLLAANGTATFAAEIAFTARQNCRNDDSFANQLMEICAGFFDKAADFVAESEGRRFNGPNAFVKKSQISVTDATTGDANQYFILGKRMRRSFGGTHGLASLNHLPA
jgi:hypothetical protein